MAQWGCSLYESFLIKTQRVAGGSAMNRYSSRLTLFFDCKRKFIKKAINAKKSLGVNSLAGIIPIVVILFAIKRLLFRSLKNIKWVSPFRNLLNESRYNIYKQLTTLVWAIDRLIEHP